MERVYAFMSRFKPKCVYIIFKQICVWIKPWAITNVRHISRWRSVFSKQLLTIIRCDIHIKLAVQFVSTELWIFYLSEFLPSSCHGYFNIGKSSSTLQPPCRDGMATSKVTSSLLQLEFGISCGLFAFLCTLR